MSRADRLGAFGLPAAALALACLAFAATLHGTGAYVGLASVVLTAMALPASLVAVLYGSPGLPRAVSWLGLALAGVMSVAWVWIIAAWVTYPGD